MNDTFESCRRVGAITALFSLFSCGLGAGCGGGGGSSDAGTGAGGAGGGAGSGALGGGSGQGGAGGGGGTTPSTATTISLGEAHPTEIVVDDSYVYWASDVGIRRISKSGGTATTLFAAQDSPSELAIDATNLYWLVHTANKDVIAAPKTGGTTITLGTGVSGGLAIDGTYAYWVIRDTAGQSLFRAVKTGASAPASISSQPGFGTLYVDDQNLYWAEGYMGRVRSMPKVGGMITDLVPADPNYVNLSPVDATSVFFTTHALTAQTSTLRRVAKSGGTVTTLATGLDQPVNIAVGDDSVYWIATGDSAPQGYLAKISKTAVTTGAPLKLATDVQMPGNLAIDAQSVYWTERGDIGIINGRVRRIAR